MKSFVSLYGVFLSLILCSCSWLENLEDPLAGPTPTPPVQRRSQPVIPGLDAGAGIPFDTLYFRIEAYGNLSYEKAPVLEKIFRTITDKTALYTFKPKEKYRVVIYKTKEEFHTKTGQPEWSGGMKTGRGIYTYEQPGLDMVLAHEVTHIIFGEFMGTTAAPYTWINEGLAMNIDAQFHPYNTFDQESASWLKLIRSQPVLELPDIIGFRVYSEKERDVSLWYKTVASLTGFLIENGGSFNFALLLKGLKNGEPLEQAFANAYPGKYRNLDELYKLWIQNYQLKKQ